MFVKISGAKISENPKLWVTPFMELGMKKEIALFCRNGFPKLNYGKNDFFVVIINNLASNPLRATRGGIALRMKDRQTDTNSCV